MTAALRRSLGPDLDAATLYALLTLRVGVFVVEQQCPYPELDGRDLAPGTRHFWLESGDGSVSSTVRLVEESEDGGTAFRIGRVCTSVAERGKGHTTRLMAAALAEVGPNPCHLNAQTYLTAMYAKHGFACSGAEFVEDGIPHVPMLRVPRP
ncbi:MAG TPA: GNAT family N-acetyltransferase [Mycobacterium sp.]|nr:GNAT family N-acetyltransferase [Mycobacterium sp.]HPZ95245.1 GNAT family N-acetyltransferase [Mycobacterium sp.]HQE14208.1 GNAT family N-acetyltransferase [Mycobacterium sp.]